MADDLSTSRRRCTERALTRPRPEAIDELVLGLTVPQRQSFYGAPTLAARLGLAGAAGRLIMQACATSVAVRARGGAARRRRHAARRGHRPHDERAARRLPVAARRAARQSENWVMDNFGCDPNTGEGMLATAERVAAQGGARRRWTP